MREEVTKHLGNCIDKGWSEMNKCEGCAEAEEKSKEDLRWEGVKGKIVGR